MTATVPTSDEFNALAARVTALEAGSNTPPNPDPPVPGDPSPDGATATEPGVVLTSAALNTFELADISGRDYGIAVNGVVDPVTHDVDTLYAKGGRIYQCANNHWYVSDDAGNWDSAQDPTRPDTPPVDPGPDPGPNPDPPPVGSIVALYTAGRGPSYTWNWGTGNDAELADAIEADAAELGVFPNAYGFFPMWGGHGAWPGNLGWAVAGMINSRVGDRMNIPVVGIMPYFSDCGYGWNDDAGLRDCADGKFDDCWRGCARAVKENGANTAIWRLGYENNFQFMPSAPQWNTESQQLWGRAFSRMSDVIRDESAKIGLTSVICLNWTTGAGSLPVENMTPDASKFDWYCTDLYNNFYADDGDINDEAQRRAYWSSAWLGMDHVIEYAQQLGKPIMAPETGAGVRPDGHSLKDSAAFWHWESEQATAIRARGMSWAGLMIWNIPAGDFDCRTTNGVQPPCVDAIKQHLADGSLVGDPAPAAAKAGAAKVTPIPGYDAEKAQAWCDEHADFIEARKRAVLDLIERARVLKPGMRA